MSDAVHADHGEHEAVEAELDRPKNGLIAIYIVGMIISVIVVIVGVYELFVIEFTGEIQSKVLDPPNSALRELRATEEARLTRYQWVSQKDGVVRIPLPRAIELTLKDYREAALAPPPPPPTDTAVAPAEGEQAKAEEGKGEEGKDGKDADAKKDEAAKADEAKKDADAKKDAAAEKPADKPAPEKPEKKKAPAPAKKPAPAPAPAPAPGGDVY